MPSSKLPPPPRRRGVRLTAVPRHPSVGLPYTLWGLFAKRQQFEELGPAAGAHVRIILWCIPIMFVVTACVIPLSQISVLSARTDAEGGSAGAWGELTWGHVILDTFLSTLFLAFIAREQLLLMQPAAFEGSLLQKNVVEKVAEGAFKPVKAVSDKVDDFVERRSLGMAFLPKVQSEKAEAASIESIGVVIGQAELVEACSIVRRPPPPRTPTSVAHACYGARRPHRSPLPVPPPHPTPRAQVLSGWGRNQPLPEGALQCVEEAAGKSPVMALQATACLAVELAQGKEKRARLALAEAEAAGKPAAALAELRSKVAAHAQYRVQHLLRCAPLLRPLALCAPEVAGHAPQAESATSAVLDAKATQTPLDYVFLTFSTSALKTRVLDRARAVRCPLSPVARPLPPTELRRPSSVPSPPLPRPALFPCPPPRRATSSRRACKSPSSPRPTRAT